jgi:tetratricopeptide (TPR) repeat protein
MNAPMNRGDEGRHRELYTALTDKWLPADLGRMAEFLKVNAGTNPRLLSMAAMLRLDIGENEAGLTLADEALKLQPDLLDAKAQRARALYALGKADEAIKLLEENLTVDVYHVPSNYWISRILALEGRDPNRAQDLARRAVFDARHGLAEWSNLTFVYRRTGRADLSRGEALKMSRAHTGAPLPLYCLGMAFYAENKTNEARENLQEAIAKGLTGEPLAEAREVLAKLRS